MEGERNKIIAETFRQLRIAQQLTREQLAERVSTENDNLDNISVKTIQRIELNGQIPKAAIFDSLLKALKTTRIQFEEMVEGINMPRFECDFTEIWDLGYAKNFKLFATKLEALKQKPYCNTNIPQVAQAILLLEAVLASNVEKNYTLCLSKLAKALQLTTATLLDEQNNVDCIRLASTKLTLYEGRIINLMATTFTKQGKSQRALDLILSLVDSLEGNSENYRVTKKMLPSIYFNASNMLIRSEQYENALDMVENGIAHCQRIKELKMLHKLYCNKGDALYQLEDLSGSERAFLDACNAARLYGDIKVLEIIREFAKAQCGFELP